jgi:hypothetical protein
MGYQEIRVGCCTCSDINSPVPSHHVREWVCRIHKPSTIHLQIIVLVRLARLAGFNMRHDNLRLSTLEVTCSQECGLFPLPVNILKHLQVIV